MEKTSRKCSVSFNTFLNKLLPYYADFNVEVKELFSIGIVSILCV